jgi:Flp pilus assembly protein CpaB
MEVMKLAVVTLLVLGMVAAGSAAFVVQWVQAKNTPQTGSNLPVDVVLAQADLPARTRLTVDHVKVERVPKAGLPADYFTSQAQAIGKTLKVAVVKGQPLAASCFLPETAIDDLLRPGMLAFQIALARRSTVADLLYPGCIVDVFATFPLQDRKKGDAVTAPLLQNIQVLAVRDQTVVSVPEEKDKKRESALTRGMPTREGEMTVALEVTARQAAALQLAMERGTLGLAMRNPLDKNLNPTDPMVVKEGQLTASSEAMDAQTLTLVNQLQTLLGNRPPDDPNCAPSPWATVASDPNAPVPAASDPTYFGSATRKRSGWQMTIIRGQKVEEAEIKLKNGQGEDTAPADADPAPVGTK